jgi:hypothetical protein
VGTRPGVVSHQGQSAGGWTGWWGGYQFNELADILTNNLYLPEYFDQHCMIYRYRFEGGL